LAQLRLAKPGSVGYASVMSGRLCSAVVVAVLAVAPGWPMPAAAQPAAPAVAPSGKPVDAVDALEAWRRLNVSRAAIKDQVELCDDDAERFRQVGRELRPDGAADATEWSEWGALLRDAGLELQSCLRAYKKQIGLLRADTKTLHEVLLAVKDAKRMTLGPKQLGEATRALDDGMGESDAADQHVAALAEAADKAAADALRALRQAGVVRVEALPGFKNLL